jgi:hypothetical protein
LLQGARGGRKLVAYRRGPGTNRKRVAMSKMSFNKIKECHIVESVDIDTIKRLGDIAVGEVREKYR